MQLRRGELPTNSHRQRLATPGFAAAYAGYFSAYLARKIALLESAR
jgi:hypothetical protein